MKVHKLVICVVDFDELGAESVINTIQCQKYPNHCIAPSVITIETRDVDWSDEHPLNKLTTEKQAFEELFKT